MAKIYDEIRPLRDQILIAEMENGEKITRGGLIIPDDNGKERGIKPRWAKVYKVGKDIDFVKPGQYILVEHGRWTYGVEVEPPSENGKTLYIQKVETESIMLVSDESPDQL